VVAHFSWAQKSVPQDRVDIRWRESKQYMNFAFTQRRTLIVKIGVWH